MHACKCMRHRPCCMKLSSARKFANARVRNIYTNGNFAIITVINFPSKPKMAGDHTRNFYTNWNFCNYSNQFPFKPKMAGDHTRWERNLDTTESTDSTLVIPARSRFFWTGWVVWATNTRAVGLAWRCRRRFDPRSRSFSLSSTSIIYPFALFIQLPFSSLSCAGSSWLPLPLVSFPSFSLLPTPNRPCQSERSSKARHKADSFEPAEWSERLQWNQAKMWLFLNNFSASTNWFW